MKFFFFIGSWTLSAADQSIQPEDLTLPVVNFKFDFPARDVEAGGQHSQNVQGAAAFQKRVQVLEASIEHQEQVFAAFLATANRQLDRLSEVFHGVASLRSQSKA